jgi:hypothetical protein
LYIDFEIQSTLKNKRGSMEIKNNHLENLSQIRSIMEESTMFLSLSGLSGIAVGFFGLIAMILAAVKLKGILIYNWMFKMPVSMNDLYFFFFIATGSLSLAILSAAIITMRKSKKHNLAIWDKTSRKFIISLFTPLVPGGIFTLTLIYYGLPNMVSSSMLLFYGLALINCSKYTRKEIYILGYIELFLSMISLFWFQGSLILWGLGFGVFNIVYGITMQIKYEK